MEASGVVGIFLEQRLKDACSPELVRIHAIPVALFTAFFIFNAVPVRTRRELFIASPPVFSQNRKALRVRTSLL
jgi:hypothetical protein